MLTDNWRQVIKMGEVLEKRLKRDGTMDEYNSCFQEFLDRGCMRKLTNQEMAQWDGVVNYVSHHGVVKSTSNSTPLRIVSNSSLNNNSGHSFNSILAKGPNSIQPLFNILVRDRPIHHIPILTDTDFNRF